MHSAVTLVTGYRRALIKVSGESLMGEQPSGIDPASLDRIAADLVEITNSGIEVAVVVGGGNIYRGLAGAAAGMDRVTGDYMGMLATVINGLALQNALAARGATAQVVSALAIAAACETYDQRRALEHLRAGRIVVFVAGTGNPFFTTDTAATLRAIEMSCDVLVKGTQVDGVYSADPKTDPDATHFEQLSHTEVLERDLKVMDSTAITLARDNRLPILVCSIWRPGNLAAVLSGSGRFTTVTA